MKRLSRMPHVFDCVVEENDSFFKFRAKVNDGGEQRFCVKVSRMRPSITVVEVTDGLNGASSFQMRLPQSADPDKAAVEYSDGVLAVTIEKRTEGTSEEEV